VKRATSSAGPDEKRPLRETGEFFFMLQSRYFGGMARIVTRGNLPLKMGIPLARGQYAVENRVRLTQSLGDE
jgi:hypothetical protein